MKLKRLSLAGFKTFADKTDIELGDGVTAVVGPNGCGKSNIADALLWVLGEQNPRLLRGSEGRDFIFSGSERRKPMGMAEVRLVVDNSDNSLPVEYAEIEITRRIYRSGESRYTMNGTQCRLKDIVDLFLDTGMGRGAYSFISQNEVDAVLSARPEDRRELFEEAAGVQKYRTRKREAMRKLETAEANLTRVNDIVRELDRQIEPLRGQAQIAERYIAMTERLRAIEIGVLISEVKRADYELYAARHDRAMDIEAVREFDDRLAGLERRNLAARERLGEAETELEAASLARQGATTQVERTEHELQLTLERTRNAEASAATLEQDIRDLLEREQALEAEIRKDKAKSDRLDADERARNSELAEARAHLAAAELAFRNAEQEGRDRAQEQRRLLAERSTRETALAACRARIGETQRRLDETRADVERQAHIVARAEADVKDAQRLVSDLEAETRTAAERQAVADAAVREAEDARAIASSAVEAARRRLVEVSARLRTLNELHESGEGLYQGVRAVLDACRKGSLQGRFRTVVDVLRVPEKLRTAIEVALGSDAQSLICSSDHEARAAIALLKQGRLGRATFLPLNILDPPKTLDRSPIHRAPGALGAAAQLVEFDAEFAPAVNLLLGRVAVFDTVNSATSARHMLQGWRRFVTLDGETLTPGGALTGGSIGGKASRLVSRKGEIDDLGVETERLMQTLDDLTRELERADAALGDARASAAGAAQDSAKLHTALLESRRDASAQERALATECRRADDLVADVARLERTLADLRREEAEWVAQLEAHDRKDTEADADTAEADRKLAEAARALEDARTRSAAVEVEVGRLSEQARAARAALKRSTDTIEQLRELRAAKQTQREAISQTIATCDRERVTLEAASADARRKLEECESAHSGWREERQRRLEESFAIAAEIKSISEQRRVTMDSLHEEELRIARLEIRVAQSAQKLADDYGMSLEEALGAPDPGDMDKDTMNEIIRLRREIRAMGAVNTGAAEEFRRLSERYEFLETQRADLQAASASLRETVAEIDRSTRAVFMETFEAVSREFGRLFERLFGGGRTRLVLTNPDDLLETGIEVIAQPPGKKATSLTLLSGGERALTATALLFSFLTVRPSPFVVLDEVDAPLDGHNVDKFAQLVADYAQDTQFLVITHNPTTMEHAPRWYGVTMQEPGVSRVVSYAPS